MGGYDLKRDVVGERKERREIKGRVEKKEEEEALSRGNRWLEARCEVQ